MGIGNWAGIALAGLAISGAPSASLQMDGWDPPDAASVHTVAVTGAGRAIVLSKGHAEIPAAGFSESVLDLLAARGLVRADAASADLWLRAHLLLRRGGGRQEPAAAGGPAAGGARGHGAEMEVVLELLRRTTGEVVWTGSALARLAHPFWTSEGRQELLNLAARLLAPVHGGEALAG